MTDELELVPVVTPEPKEETHFKNGYYRAIEDVHECVPTGEMVYVHIGEKVRLYAGKRELHYDLNQLENLMSELEFMPDGATVRQQQVVALMEEISNTDTTMQDVRGQLTGFNPHVENNELTTSTTLVKTGSDIQTVKRAVATLRNDVMKTSKELSIKMGKLQQLIEEQSNILAAKAAEMKLVIKEMEEAIWTINLYLGRNEEIHILRKGKPAPTSDKITIRQTTLYMDEECAINARDEGIDIENVGEFDKWIVENDQNLHSILPEEKGIIALRIKRHGKDYGDPWTNQQKNEANTTWTYFLIRNGENLYRVYVDIKVGKILFPNGNDFENELWENEYDREKDEYVRRPLKPGSDKYMKAMKEASDERKHYLRIALVLQGLMDRTPIFKPMPIDRINLCDPDHCAEWLNLIYETEFTITDGKPLFNEWLTSINSKLEVGNRIMGVFDYASGLRGSKNDYEKSRIYPANATYPDSNKLYTIEEARKGTDDTEYVFRYERTGDTVYRRSTFGRFSYGESKTKASCWVTKTDKFILNFDEATIEEMMYYVNHRLSRKDYHNMVPLLQTSIAIKQQETKDEEPFKLLLIGQIMQKYGVESADAECKVDELVRWWKFKNRTHRALSSDDSKALTMIVDEFGLRQKQEAVRSRNNAINNTIIAVIGTQSPPPVYIAHKSDNKYVAYVPHNDQNIWVIEQTWSYNRQTGDIKLKEAKQWKTVDKRHERWETIYTHERWASWRILPQLSTILTDGELQRVVGSVCERLKEKLDGSPIKKSQAHLFADDMEGARTRFLPLIVTHSDFKIVLWYSDSEPKLPKTNIVSNSAERPSLAKLEVVWKRTINGVEEKSSIGWPSHYCLSGSKEILKYTTGHTVIQEWPENQALFDKEFAMVKEHQEKARELRHKHDYIATAVEKIVFELAVANAHKEYDTEFGDPELWDDHLKTLKIQKPHFDHIYSMGRWMAERDINIIGMSLSQLYEKAQEVGYFEDRGELPTGKWIDMIPMDFIIPPPKPKNDEE